MSAFWQSSVAGLAVVLALAGPATAKADDPPFQMPKFSAKDMVPLVHGPNWVDLDGDGRKDLVVKSRWEINGPHSASVYSVQRHLRRDDPFRYDGPDWHLVPFIKSASADPHGVASIVTHEGADCVLRDLRLFTRGKVRGGETFAVLAEREIGDGFADKRPFTFRVFKLLRARDAGDDELQNFIAVSFRLVGEVVSKEAYCGANEAFWAEYRIPNPEKFDERR